MRKKSKLVYGIGINDAEYSVQRFEKKEGKSERVWCCPFYEVWKHMLERCYSKNYHSKHPTYIGCSVCKEWITFSQFRYWMTNQDWEGKHLDKDILIPINKVYRPDACVFVSGRLNTFMLDRGSASGKFPIGVSWSEKAGKFVSLCSNPFTGNREYLGIFSDPSEAYEAWRAKKHEHACRYADMQTDARVANALRTRYAKECA